MTNPMQSSPTALCLAAPPPLTRLRARPVRTARAKYPGDLLPAAQGRFSRSRKDFYNKHPPISTCASASASTVSASPSLEPHLPNGTGEINPEGVALSRAFRHLQQSWALSYASRSITSIRPRPLPERRRGIPDAHDNRRLCRVRQVLLCRVHRDQALVYLTIPATAEGSLSSVTAARREVSPGQGLPAYA